MEQPFAYGPVSAASSKHNLRETHTFTEVSCGRWHRSAHNNFHAHTERSAGSRQSHVAAADSPGTTAHTER